MYPSQVVLRLLDHCLNLLKTSNAVVMQQFFPYCADKDFDIETVLFDLGITEFYILYDEELTNSKKKLVFNTEKILIRLITMSLTRDQQFFTSVDKDRIKEIGLDRACAEWLIRNGASVKWCGHSELYSEYTHLSHLDTKARLCLEEIYASNASLRHNGFPYLTDGLKHLKKITFHDCQQVDDKVFPYLENVKNSLQELHILSCHSVTDDGILSCKNLTNLHTLELKDLSGLKLKEKVLQELQKSLPSCNVTLN